MTFWLLGSLAATNAPISAAAGPGRARDRGTGGAALAHERDVAARGGGARARCTDGTAAHRDRRRSDLVTSASVAAAGIIGWVGLIVPHMARALVGPDFARLLPASAMLGGGYLLFIDTIARTAASIEIPLGILTAFIGTPFFIWLLASVQRTWS